MSKHRNPRPRLPKPPTHNNSDPGRRAAAKEPEPAFNVAEAVDGLRHLLKRASTLVVATAGMIDLSPWGGNDEDRARMEGIAYLVEVTIETMIVTTEAGDRIAAQLAKRKAGA